VLIVDDLLAAPIKGLLWVFQEIQKNASAEQHARRDEIMAALSALYRDLEQGEITDDAFDAREQALLDELDALNAREDEDELDEDAEEGVFRSPGEDEASTPGRAAEVFAEVLRSVETQGPEPSGPAVVAAHALPSRTVLDEEAS
jgi:hypothetical protein